MEELTKSWEFHYENAEIVQSVFEIINFSQNNEEWVVSIYTFDDGNNPATWGGKNNTDYSFSNFLNQKPKGLPNDIYQEVSEIIHQYNQKKSEF